MPVDKTVCQDQIMTVNEFCDLLKISRVFLQEHYLYRKDFPAFKVGRLWRIKAKDALDYVEMKGKRR